MSLAATTRRGRSTAMPMDLVVFKILRLLSQPRLSRVTGVDLRGTSLGVSRGGREGGPSVLIYLTTHCRHIRRLLLQVRRQRYIVPCIPNQVSSTRGRR